MSVSQPEPSETNQPEDSSHPNPIGVFEDVVRLAKEGRALKQQLAGLGFYVLIVPDSAAPYLHRCDTAEQAAEYIRNVSVSGKPYVIQGYHWRITKNIRRLVSPDGNTIIPIDREASLEFEDDGSGSLADPIFPESPKTGKIEKSSAADII